VNTNNVANTNKGVSKIAAAESWHKYSLPKNVSSNANAVLYETTRKLMKGCIYLLAIVLCFISCGKEDPTPADNTVHLAGFLAAPEGHVFASYWKDGVQTSLHDESIYSQVSSLSVDGSTVRIGGYRWNSGSVPLIWINGSEEVIENAFGGGVLVTSRNNILVKVWFDGFHENDATAGWLFSKNGTTQEILDTASNIGPSGVALLGNDLYISGSSSFHDGSGPDNPTFQNAQYWKNGQLMFRESANSSAWSIFIHGNDVYISGHVFAVNGTNSVACYWKNGQRVNLTGEAALATSIYVTDSHVYAAGTIRDQAVYWKDGVVTNLTTSGTYSMANSIFVKGDDVHVGGYARGFPAYWKNDVRQVIANQDKQGQIKFVVVGSN
jgi:hypothetical protein